MVLGLFPKMLQIITNLVVVIRKALSVCRLYHFHELDMYGQCRNCPKQVVAGKILLMGGHHSIHYIEVPGNTELLAKQKASVVELQDMARTSNIRRLQTIVHLRDDLGKSWREIGKALNISHVSVIEAYNRAVGLSTGTGLQGKKKERILKAS